MRDRFEIDLLDPDDPFEIDDQNRPHLYKHLPAVSGRYVAIGVEEILDVYLFGDPMYLPGHEEGQADWVMIGETPGVVLKVPLAPPNQPDPRKCRPIGLDGASEPGTQAPPRVGEQAMTNSGAENQNPVGPRARAGQARLLTSHVPIRFRAQTIEKAKAIAERDGMTVSSWIRGVVEREVERRMPAFPQTHRSESGVTVRITRRTDPTVEAETQNRYYDPDRAQLESV